MPLLLSACTFCALATSPALIAGNFVAGGESATRFAYSILLRQSFATDLRYRGDIDVDSLATIGALSFRLG